MFQRKSIRFILYSISALLVSSGLFMNCSKDSLPAEASSVRTENTPPNPLYAIASPNPVETSSTSVITVSGGKPPYTVTKDAGAGVLTGLSYATPSSPEMAYFKIKDANDEYVFVTINVIAVTPPEPPVIPGEQIFDNPGNFTFTIPQYNNLVVEVWGGGGGGQQCGVLNGVPVCQYGGAGGNSSFDTLIARGGVGYVPGAAEGGDINASGEGGNWNGSNCPGLGGASGGPLGSATRQGGVPGGGGNSICFGWGANGGGGGGYSVKQYAKGRFAVGSTVNGFVGAGGAASGAHGRIKFTWN